MAERRSEHHAWEPEPPRYGLARILAPLALLGALLVLALVVAGSLGSDDDGGGAETAARESRGGGGDGGDGDGGGGNDDGPETPKEYEVQEGDSLSSIAAEYGISVKRIERLNEDVDPQALSTGQTLKLR
jgi:hypothetical protein